MNYDETPTNPLCTVEGALYPPQQEHLKENPGTVQIRGKFFYRDGKKLYVKGVTYGTFAPRDSKDCFPPPSVIEHDFSMMHRYGINVVRTYTVPPVHLLHLAIKYDLLVMVGIPWEQHITFLDRPDTAKSIIRQIYDAVALHRGHPAILCYSIGNEIPAGIVRWYGKERIERFLRKLYRSAKKADPARLISYVNYPTTEYLNLDFLDFCCFNVYLETARKLKRYIARLHNLAGEKPLLMAEIGMDSLKNGKQRQAEFFSWQIPLIFSLGCAGMFVFSWTDEWWRGGYQIEDWKFGIVDSARRPKPALLTVSKVLREVPARRNTKLPHFSLVICTYNGSATIRECLEAVMKLDYPHFEVLVVNDGSTDEVPEIVSAFPVTLISTSNRGLSAARNTGLAHAAGEIVAYLDDDAYPDEHWLKYLASAYLSTPHAGVGGPNLPPAGDPPVAICVANAPGGPVHVLLSDEVAEHIPGCNMSFRKEILQRVGGFDPTFRVAGDDVDICWKIQEAGYTIGFHPAAVVWHHRRNSVKAYWKQQIGYGKAEALLEAKWPEKYNRWGHLCWAGRLYGNGISCPLRVKKEKVFHGTWGTAPFQSIYEPAQSLWSSLPLMPEWFLLVAILGIGAAFGSFLDQLLWLLPLFILTIIVVIIQAAESTCNYLNKSKNPVKLKYRLLIIGLHLVQPIARLYGRIFSGLTPWRSRHKGRRSQFLFKFAPTVFTAWSENWLPPESWLCSIETTLVHLKVKVRRGGDFDAHDLTIYNGLLSRSRCALVIEEHGGGKQYLRFRCTCDISVGSALAIACPAMLSISSVMRDHLILAGFFGLLSVLLFLRRVHEYAGTLTCMEYAFKMATGQNGTETVQLYESSPETQNGDWNLNRQEIRA